MRTTVRGSVGGAVPLSEHEQRLLEQIEQALYAEDPKFASLYRANDLHSHYRRRVIRAAVVFLAGLGLLLAGVTTAIVAMGVAGFVVMLGAASLIVASLQRMNGRGAAPIRVPGAEAAAGGSRVVPLRSRRARLLPVRRRNRRARAAPRASIVARLQERFLRRFDR